MKRILGLILVLCLVMTPSAAFAASPWTEAETYGEKTVQKLDFGFKNLFVGWIDLFQEPYNAQQEGKSWYMGLGKGLLDSLANMVGGAAHLATFPIPVDIPLPDNGVQI